MVLGRRQQRPSPVSQSFGRKERNRETARPRDHTARHPSSRVHVNRNRNNPTPAKTPDNRSIPVVASDYILVGRNYRVINSRAFDGGRDKQTNLVFKAVFKERNKL